MYIENSFGVTNVSNVFIDKYLSSANAAQIKVYLYLLRNLNAGTGIESVQAIADELDYPIGDIFRSLKYWEKRNVISVEYDDDGEIKSIGLNYLKDVEKDNLISGIFKRVEEEDCNEKKDCKDSPLQESSSSFSKKMSNSSVCESASEKQSEVTLRQIPVKRTYSYDELDDFKNNLNGKELLEIAESYFKHPLQSIAIQSLLYYKKDLGFSDEVIDILLQYGAKEERTKNFHYIDVVAESWYERGVDSVEKAQMESQFNDNDVREVMRYVGRYTNPGVRERAMITAWFRDGFPMEVIQHACNIAKGKDKAPDKLQYAYGILRSYKENGLYDLKSIEEAEKKYKEDLEKKYQEAGGKKTYYKKQKKPANVDNYIQGEYDDSDFDIFAERDD